jgi:hypothetical protein
MAAINQSITFSDPTVDIDDYIRRTEKEKEAQEPGFICEYN